MRNKKLMIIGGVMLVAILFVIFKIINPDLGITKLPTELYLTFDCKNCVQIYKKVDNSNQEYRVFFKVESNVEYETYTALLSANNQGKFNEFLEQIYITSISNTIDLNQIAEKIELDIEKFEEDMNSSQINIEVQDKINYIASRGITKFPSILINNRIVLINEISDLNNYF